MSVTFDNHVIIGAGGAITHALVPEILRLQQAVTLVSRRGTAMPGAVSVKADAADYESLAAAIPEGSVVYLLVGLPYRADIWEQQWPPLVENVMRVCAQKQAILLFFDNVYMYGPVDGPMTEDTAHRPVSRKGAVRAQLAERLLEGFSADEPRGAIARSADFYGPGAGENGIPNLLVLKRMLEGKSPQWMINADYAHSLTYTSDCGRALTLLASDEDAWGRVWHLPTAHPPISLRRFAEIAGEQFSQGVKMALMPRWMLRLGGIFDATIRELPEMAYQYDRDYIFDSTAFETRFSFVPTTYETGIRETIAYLRTN